MRVGDLVADMAALIRSGHQTAVAQASQMVRYIGL